MKVARCPPWPADSGAQRAMDSEARGLPVGRARPASARASDWPDSDQTSGRAPHGPAVAFNPKSPSLHFDY
jgi:hypothetical protein